VFVSLGSSQTNFEEWKSYTPEDQWGSTYRIYWDQSEGALRAELFNSTFGWKTINSPLIPVNSNTTYQLKFSVKAENGSAVHYKIFEYNSSMQYVNSTFDYIGDGSFDWKNISCIYMPSDPTVSYMQLQVWHGHETNQSLPNIVWIRNVTVHEELDQLDVILVYPLNESSSNSTLESLFSTDEVPAIVKNYTRVNPTLWKLELDSTKPFILSFAEVYDPAWEARVYKDGNLVERLQPIELYNFINGYRINTTGTNLEVQIVYTQQERFDTGLIFTGLTLASILFFLFYDWRRTRKLKGSALPFVQSK